MSGYPTAVASTVVALCPACGAMGRGFATTPTGRTNALCRRCSSLERHRFLTVLMQAVVAERPPVGLVIDVAPSRQVSPLIRELRPEGYLSMDFDPAADGRLVDVVASLTHIPAPDRSTSLLVCYHVLEHVPDDRRAMREIARVLSDDGVALLQVPWRNRPTDEDPSASAEERLARFGQADHVRWYGHDFVMRLEESGLRVQELAPQEVLPERITTMFGIIPAERVWLCTRAGAPALDLDAVRRRVPDALGEVFVRVIEAAAWGLSVNGMNDADRWEAEAERWKRRYLDLRNKLPVRAMVAVRRPFVRGRGQ